MSNHKPLTKITVIGGFFFNVKPLHFLNNLTQTSTSIKFIDINLLNIQHINLDNIIYNVVKFLQPEHKNIIIGYSMGGLIGIKLSHMFPNLVDKLILLNSTPKFLEDRTTEPHFNGIKYVDYKRLQSKLQKTTLSTFVKYFIRLTIYPNKITHLNIANIVNKYCDTQTLDKQTLEQLLAILDTCDLRHEFQHLSCKTLMLNGIEDVLVSYNNFLSVNQILIPNQGHIYFPPNEDFILNRIEKFCNE